MSPGTKRIGLDQVTSVVVAEKLGYVHLRKSWTTIWTALRRGQVNCITRDRGLTQRKSWSRVSCCVYAMAPQVFPLTYTCKFLRLGIFVMWLICPFGLPFQSLGWTMKELCLHPMQNIHQVTHAEAISFNCVGKERDGNMDLTKVFLKY